jgi:hypothetical protein
MISASHSPIQIQTQQLKGRLFYNIGFDAQYVCKDLRMFLNDLINYLLDVEKSVYFLRVNLNLQRQKQI